MLLCILIFAGCSTAAVAPTATSVPSTGTVAPTEISAPTQETAVTEINPTAEKAKTESEQPMKISIQIGEREFSAILEVNPTTQAITRLLPLTLNMTELNGNEKYYQFSSAFPTNEESVEMIQTGDLMLYGEDYLVLFYKTFQTSYRYTRLGHIENVAGLTEAVGNGSVQVTLRTVGQSSIS